MESSERSESDHARTALADAESARARLASSLQLPSCFYSSIGAAIAIQIGTGAVGISAQQGWGLAVVAAGGIAFGVAAGVQLARFRRLNGAWLGGLASQVLLGTAGLAYTTYAAAFASATWAAFAGAWWLVAVTAVAGGLAYAWAGRRWWHSYRLSAPAQPSLGDRVVMQAAAVVLALAGLVVLVALR